MGTYTATVHWKRSENELFVDNQYSRAHRWCFDGGAEIAASASPQIVPLPHAVAENVDPEEAFVAALSSCHMLFFLAIAAKKRYCIDRYVDEAEGHMSADANGKQWMSEVVLRPRVAFCGDRQPERAQIEHMHHLAHVECFIANSVKSVVRVDAVLG